MSAPGHSGDARDPLDLVRISVAATATGASAAPMTDPAMTSPG